MATSAAAVTVDFDERTNEFLIRSGTKEKRVNAGALFDQFSQKPTGVDTFAELNTAINHGDSVKDGTNQATLSGLGLYQEHPLSLDNLKSLAHSIIDACKTEGTILRQAFTRNKKGDNSVKNHYQGMKFDVGFDAGLGLENYLEDAQQSIIDTFGKYIDPSTTRNANSSFPKKNTPLVITENAFKQIGYENCFLSSASNVGKDQYNYTLNLSGSVLINADKPRKQDENINTILVGNAKKKSITDRQQKIAAVIGKGLGDKLQVFIMHIKSVFEPSDRISCISTCDEIVLMFCILLRLPCFYTSVGKDKTLDKINEVIYYNVDNTNPTKAAARFNTEKVIVKKAYTELIKLLRGIDNSSVVYVSGDTKSYNFRPEFYQGLILDLTHLLEIVESTVITAEERSDIRRINAKTSLVLTMTPANFIKKNRDGGSFMLVRTANKYSEYAKSYPKPEIAEKLGVGKNLTSATFFYIGTDYAKPISVRGGYNPTRPSDLEFFDLTPAPVYQTVYSAEEPKTVVFDANAELLKEIAEIVKQTGQIPYFADIYSELLDSFQYDPNYRTSHLTAKIKEIVEDIKHILSIETVSSRTSAEKEPKYAFHVGKRTDKSRRNTRGSILKRGVSRKRTVATRGHAVAKHYSVPKSALNVTREDSSSQVNKRARSFSSRSASPSQYKRQTVKQINNQSRKNSRSRSPNAMTQIPMVVVP